LVISQVLRFFRLKPGFSLAKPRFLAEVVQKLKFPNNSIIFFPGQMSGAAVSNEI
jgi:hypothetical protein